MNIEANVLNEIMSTIGSVSPETGGIIGTQNDVVCAYYFDRTGSCDSNTYKPDTVTVNSVISDWTQRSIQFAGIVHSHLEDRCELSCADIKYAQLITTASKAFSSPIWRRMMGVFLLEEPMATFTPRSLR